MSTETESFLQGWKSAVTRVGEDCFYCAPSFQKPNNIHSIVSREQVRPDYEQFIKKLNVTKRHEEAAFICAIYSFFNAEDGLRLLHKYTPFHSFVDDNMSDDTIKQLQLNHTKEWTESFSVELLEYAVNVDSNK